MRKAPADCPNAVTFSGSPPKFKMLALTHSNIAITSYAP
jgi:hypothetical protein